MKTNVNRIEKVQEALDHGQKGKRAGLFYSADMVAGEAEAAEKALADAGIRPFLRQGSTVIAHARVGTKHWAAPTTTVHLKRGVDNWFLTDIVRGEVWDERRVRIYPPTDFDLATHARRVLRAAGVEA